MIFRLGLTGSIGMGKSTTAKIFADLGCKVWDADAAVHRLYQPGGAAVDPIRREFPDAIVGGAVSRDALKRIIGGSPDALNRIEAIVHPLVAQDRQAFVDDARSGILVFDIPLLFETGGTERMDAVAVTSVASDVQERRVMERGTMTKEQYQQIVRKQMPDEEKRAKADYVIITDTLDHARSQVQGIINEIRTKMKNA